MTPGIWSTSPQHLLLQQFTHFALMQLGNRRRSSALVSHNLRIRILGTLGASTTCRPTTHPGPTEVPFYFQLLYLAAASVLGSLSP